VLSADVADLPSLADEDVAELFRRRKRIVRDDEPVRAATGGDDLDRVGERAVAAGVS
jgi:hypothetical protein